jgi:hypothetical protein
LCLWSSNLKKNRFPSLQEIEVLTSYLPRLYADGFSPVLSWEGGKRKDGTFSLPYPKYNPLVEEFYYHAATACWLDYEYSPEQAAQMLKDENLINSASLEQIKTMLTFCVRGERFSDGHWAQMIEDGHIRRLLERLVEIKAQLFTPG